MTSLSKYFTVGDKISFGIIAVIEEHLSPKEMQGIADKLGLGNLEIHNHEPVFIRPAQALWSGVVSKNKVLELLVLLNQFVIETLN